MSELNIENPQEIYEFLLSLSNDQHTIMYKDLLLKCGLETNPGTVAKLTKKVLNPLITFNFEHEEPFLSVLVINKKKGMPGKGFFDIMKIYGYSGQYEGENARDSFEQELESVWNWDWESKQFNDFINEKSNATGAIKNETVDLDKKEVCETLKVIASEKQTITYGELLSKFGLKINPAMVSLLVNILDQIIDDNLKHSEPILASLVVRKTDLIPGIGFFNKMYSMGRYSSLNGIQDYKQEIEDVWKYQYS